MGANRLDVRAPVRAGGVVRLVALESRAEGGAVGVADETLGCVTGCGRLAHRRGLCTTCKARRDRAIAAGETTDAELVAKGLRLPRKSKGPGWTTK